MLFWYVGVSIVAVHEIFRSQGLDYRLIALGALLPLVLDLPSGRFAYAHSLVAGVALLSLVMLLTTGRPRLLRRRIICLPIGYLAGLVLSGAFLHDVSFLWPLLGSDFPADNLVPPATVAVLMEATGIAVTIWAWSRFGLADSKRRQEFLRSGRLVEVRPR